MIIYLILGVICRTVGTPDWCWIVCYVCVVFSGLQYFSEKRVDKSISSCYNIDRKERGDNSNDEMG